VPQYEILIFFTLLLYMDRQLRKMLVLKIEADILHFVFEANAECGLKKLSAHWVCTTKFDLHTECALKMF
jgi:hypothetical protein